MRLIVRQDYEEVCAYAGKQIEEKMSLILYAILMNNCTLIEFLLKKKAYYVKERINQFKPTAEQPFVLGLPTGSSPMGVYHKLVEFYKAGELSFEHVVTFNMDEYVGLPRYCLQKRESIQLYIHSEKKGLRFVDLFECCIGTILNHIIHLCGIIFSSMSTSKRTIYIY